MDKQKAVRKEKEGAFVDLLNQEMRELQDSMKQKQIEEMANCKSCYERVGNCYFKDRAICTKWTRAVNLYEQGFRKIPENAVVLTREEYDKLKKQDLFMKDYTSAEVLESETKKTRKETAEKFAKEFHARINERRFFSMDMMKNSMGDMAQYWNGKINEQSCVRVDIDEIAKEMNGGG